MSKTAKPKKRGRPATGRDPMMGFRAAPVLRASIVKWAENRPDIPTLSEATRRLVELGLTVKTKGRQSNEGQRRRAREMAGSAIDAMTDATAHADDQASRKRRLLKGPEEFRETRVDRPKEKSCRNDSDDKRKIGGRNAAAPGMKRGSQLRRADYFETPQASV